MKKAELVFIPAPATGHLVSTIEFTERLISHEPRLSITILAMNSPYPTPTNTTSQNNPTTAARFISLPQVVPPPMEIMKKSVEEYISTYVASHIHYVREEITTLQNSSGNPVYMVVDMFCASMIDVAHELGIPSYVFFTSSAAFLGLILHLPDRYNQTVLPKFDESEPEVVIPSYLNSVPSFALPPFAYTESGFTTFMSHANKYKETKGIVINTVAELEPYAIDSLTRVVPVYSVGPVLDLNGSGDQAQRVRLVRWLDTQPDASVVFLCFGSAGAFSESQVREIANGISQSGQRFIWSLRKQKAMEYTESELKKVLPRGLWALVEQGRGVVCGWAPQVDILAHNGVGSFVSHCGWNSTLESVWFGKPMVAWPLYAEQRSNAFELVSELGLASTWLGLGRKPDDLVRADEVERAIRLVMAQDNLVRTRIRKASEVCKKAVMKGGSSFNSTRCFIRSILKEQL